MYNLERLHQCSDSFLAAASRVMQHVRGLIIPDPSAPDGDRLVSLCSTIDTRINAFEFSGTEAHHLDCFHSDTWGLLSSQTINPWVSSLPPAFSPGCASLNDPQAAFRRNQSSAFSVRMLVNSLALYLCPWSLGIYLQVSVGVNDLKIAGTGSQLSCRMSWVASRRELRQFR